MAKTVEQLEAEVTELKVTIRAMYNNLNTLTDIVGGFKGYVDSGFGNVRDAFTELQERIDMSRVEMVDDFLRKLKEEQGEGEDWKMI